LAFGLTKTNRLRLGGPREQWRASALAGKLLPACGQWRGAITIQAALIFHWKLQQDPIAEQQLWSPAASVRTHFSFIFVLKGIQTGWFEDAFVPSSRSDKGLQQ
jgi:hypothetical protein